MGLCMLHSVPEGLALSGKQVHAFLGNSNKKRQWVEAAIEDDWRWLLEYCFKYVGHLSFSIFAQRYVHFTFLKVADKTLVYILEVGCLLLKNSLAVVRVEGQRLVPPSFPTVPCWSTCDQPFVKSAQNSTYSKYARRHFWPKSLLLIEIMETLVRCLTLGHQNLLDSWCCGLMFFSWVLMAVCAATGALCHSD